jgi:foldase protein PrsA
MIENMSKNQIKVISYIIFACTILGLFIAYEMLTKPEVIASVNGNKITKNELYNALVKTNGEQVLESLISEKIVELESAKQNIVISDADYQQELNKYYEYYGGEAGFTQALEMNGYTLDQVKGDIVNNLSVRKLLGPQISISDEELKAYFEENKATFAKEKQVRASHILVDNLEAATEIKQKLVNGEDFTQLAKKYSTDTTTKENGGDLGYFGSGTMMIEFEQAAFALNVGEISDPVKTEYGYHIIKLVETKAAQEANYEQSKNEINETLLERKIGDEYANWMQQLYQQYKVENFLITK